MKGIKHDNELIRYSFLNALNFGSSLLQNLNVILNEHNIRYCDIFNVDKIKLQFFNNINDDWKINLIKETISIRDFNDHSVLDNTEIKYLLHYLCCD